METCGYILQYASNIVLKLVSLPTLLAVYFSEQSFKNSCVHFLLNKTLSERISKQNSIIKLILLNPSIVILILNAIYVVFIILFVPLWGISYLLSTSVTILVFILLIILLARCVARTMTFPGSLPSVQRDISIEYIKKTLKILININNYITVYISTLILIHSAASGPGPEKIGRYDKRAIIQQREEIRILLLELKSYIDIIELSYNILTNTHTHTHTPPPPIKTKLKDSDKLIITSLLTLSNKVYNDYNEYDLLLQPFYTAVIGDHSNIAYSTVNTTNTNTAAMNPLSPTKSYTSNSTSASNSSHMLSPTTVNNSNNNSTNLAYIKAGNILIKTAEELKLLLFRIRNTLTSDKSTTPSSDSESPSTYGEDDGDGQISGGNKANPENFLSSLLTSLTSLNKGPSGITALALPMMRAQLKVAYKAEEIGMKSTDGYYIDILYIPSQVSLRLLYY